ncbi:MAG: hypothetical protein US89_C0011G0011 [Candidatus Peregrinibacteria bacterium GW2011_GWF2_38_29]|nr:MAG: hypothetical protein US89_C0011G0011 [Candidatus Peregrinibacteria bacterium GW2011_GWF2_38_29]
MENNVNKLGLEGLNDTFKMGGNSSAPATSQNPTLNNISFDQAALFQKNCFNLRN